ncbi:MAG: hypothetical protein NT072_08820 [Deltaproteobacteria bacterium]|nr:hypothetical protein [Deltaproteobacteria bacterium]
MKKIVLLKKPARMIMPRHLDWLEEIIASTGNTIMSASKFVDRMDGIRKVFMGHTDIDQVMRVCL